LCLLLVFILMIFIIFFLMGMATPEFYTLSLHDALPIYSPRPPALVSHPTAADGGDARARHARRRAHGGASHARESERCPRSGTGDRKSTRLNSSHDQISYAVFCLKKKKKQCSY